MISGARRWRRRFVSGAIFFYKNPLFVVLITYAEVLPVGLIVAFVSALILKRKTPRASPAVWGKV
jgi:hypothetical protein